jgi:hypothetical protein
MNYTPIPGNTPDSPAAIASVGDGGISLNFSTFRLISLNCAKLRVTRFDGNCNFQTLPAMLPYRLITILPPTTAC